MPTPLQRYDRLQPFERQIQHIIIEKLHKTNSNDKRIFEDSAKDRLRILLESIFRHQFLHDKQICLHFVDKSQLEKLKRTNGESCQWKSNDTIYLTPNLKKQILVLKFFIPSKKSQSDAYHVFVEATALDGTPKHEADAEIDQVLADFLQ